MGNQSPLTARCCNPEACRMCLEGGSRQQGDEEQKVVGAFANASKVFGEEAEEINMDDNLVDELAHEVELWRMETPSVGNGYNANSLHGLFDRSKDCSSHADTVFGQSLAADSDGRRIPRELPRGGAFQAGGMAGSTPAGFGEKETANASFAAYATDGKERTGSTHGEAGQASSADSFPDYGKGDLGAFEDDLTSSSGSSLFLGFVEDPAVR